MPEGPFEKQRRLRWRHAELMGAMAVLCALAVLAAQRRVTDLEVIFRTHEREWVSNVGGP